MRLYRKFFIFFILLALLFTSLPVYAVEYTEDLKLERIKNSFTYTAYVKGQGWQRPVKTGQTAGTEGKKLALTGLKLSSDRAQFKVSVHCSGIGWMDPVENNGIAGSTGLEKPIEAVKITSNHPDFDIYYRVHSAGFGWLGWAKEGSAAGSLGCNLPVEAIEINLVPRGGLPPGETLHSLIERDQFVLKSRVFKTGSGWTDYTTKSSLGETDNKTLEAVDIKVSDPTGVSGVTGEAYISGTGWQGEAGKNDPIGTTGKNKTVEALRYRLKGPAASVYDIYYRVNTPDFGWLGWSSNNKEAGTIKGNHPISAIEVVLVRKGREAPGDTTDAFIDCSIRTYPDVYGVPGMRTLQNFLALAMKPVGHTSYVLGGGRIGEEFVGGPANTHIGEWPQWRSFYNKQNASYNYEDHLFYNYDGLDCIGFVGWSVYNTLHKKDGEGGEIIESHLMPEWYASKGYGTYTPFGSVKDFKPGDIVSLGEYGHVYICLGTCPDGSLVIAHAWPPGVEIDGTLLENGKPSEATKLARIYMARYYPLYYGRYHGQFDKSYSEYARNVSKFTWSDKVVSDPEGIRNKTAPEVLKILFNEE